MLMGGQFATGDPNFVRLAGDVVSKGTLSVAPLASVLTLPDLPVRRWLHAFVPGFESGFILGGEDVAADAVGAIVNAAHHAGSRATPALVGALESGIVTQFASTVPFSFAADRHVARTRDDVALLTIEAPPDPYNLGNEWREVLPRDYVGPTHLVDFTLANNARAHPEVLATVLSRRYGTSATDDYQGGDLAKVRACRNVH
jgi:hypothetical protein